MAAKIINQRNLPKNSEVAFAAVDVNAKRVIAEHFNISYVPHLRVFTKGDTQGYRYDSFLGAYDEGQRTVYGLVNYAMKLAGYPCVQVHDEYDLVDMKKIWMRHSQDQVALGFFDDSDFPSKDKNISDVLKTFADYAEDEKNITIHLTTNKTLADKFKVKAPHVMILKNYDEGRVDLPAELLADKTEVANFMERNTVPRLTTYKHGNGFLRRKVWEGSYTKHLVLFADRSDPEGYKKAFQEVEKACKQIGSKHDRGTTLCLSIPISAEESAFGMVNFYGVDPTKQTVMMFDQQDRTPADIDLMMQNGAAGISTMDERFTISHTYKMDGDVTEEAVNAFVKSCEDGSATRYHRAAMRAPEKSVPAVLVGAELQETVMTTSLDKYVLVKFTDNHIETYCSGTGGKEQKKNCVGNFTEYTQTFAAVAAKYADEEDLEIVQYDIRSNDVSHWAPEVIKSTGARHFLDIYDALLANGPLHIMFQPNNRSIYSSEIFRGNFSDVDSFSKFVDLRGKSTEERAADAKAAAPAAAEEAAPAAEESSHSEL
jgi:hypothetical protein